MVLSAKIWPELERLIPKGKIKEAIEVLEREIPHAEGPDDIAQISRRLCHLYRLESPVKSLAKAAQFTLLAGEAYCVLGRFGPSTAMLKQLKEVDPGQKLYERLKRKISQVFSLPSADSPAKDEHLPPPTPFQEMSAMVSFERDEDVWLRDQWSAHSRQNAPLFSWLKQSEVYELVHLAVLRELPAGALLFREGDAARAFYIVAEGEMHLSASNGFSRIFKEGDCFGEIAMFAGLPRTATLKSVAGTKLLEFSEEALQKCYEVNPHLQAKVTHFYEMRLFLHSASHHPIFEKVPNNELEIIWDQLTSIHVPKGRVLFEGPNTRDRFYLVTLGSCSGFLNDRKVMEWGPGQFIGASKGIEKIVTATECSLLECHQVVFEELQNQFPQLRNAFDPQIPFDFLEDEITRKAFHD